MIATFGKLFVFMNLIASVALGAWAVSLMSNQLDWKDKPEGFNAADENPNANDTNNLERLASKISKLNDGIKSAQTSLAAKSAFVLNAEAERDQRAAGLALRANDARNGRFRTLVYLRSSGLLDLTANNGVDVLGLDSKPLKGLRAIQNEIDVSINVQTDIMKQSYKIRKEFQAITDEISKLDDEIERQKIIKGNAEDESKYLADRATDWDEQVRTLQRKANQLKARLAEVGG